MMIKMESLLQPGSPRSWFVLMALCIFLSQSLCSLNTWHVQGLHVDNNEASVIEDNHDFKDFGADDVNFVEYEAPKPPAGFIGRAKHVATTAVAPALRSVDLIKRFRNWRNQYLALQTKYGNRDNGDPVLKDPIEVLRLEYGKVDKELVDELCGKKDGSEDIADIENLALITKIMKSLIGRLEKNLAELEENGPPKDDELSAEDLEAIAKLKEIEANQAENAVERVKRIAKITAKELVTSEIMSIVSLLVMNTGATYIAVNGQVGAGGLAGLMGRIEPFVFLIGWVNTPFAVSYAYDLVYRTGWFLAKHTLTCAMPKSKNKNLLEGSKKDN